MDDIKIIIYLLIGAFWVVSTLMKGNKKKTLPKKTVATPSPSSPTASRQKSLEEAQKRLLESMEGLRHSYRKMTGEVETNYTEDDEMAKAGSLEAVSDVELPRVRDRKEDVAYQASDTTMRTPAQEEFRNAIVWQAILNRPQF